MKAILCILGLFSFAAPAFANIGETQAQTEQRLGKPAYTRDDLFPECIVCNYRHDDYEIRVIFHKGISQSEDYFKADHLSPISIEEATSILKSNFKVFNVAAPYSKNASRWVGKEPYGDALLDTHITPNLMRIEAVGFPAKFLKLLKKERPTPRP